MCEMSLWPAGRWWEPVAALARLGGGGSSSVRGAEPRFARAPPVGCGSAAVESVWSAGQADRGLPIRPEPHAPSPQQGLCSAQVCDNLHIWKLFLHRIIGTLYKTKQQLKTYRRCINSPGAPNTSSSCLCSLSGRGGQIYLGARALSCLSPSSTMSVLW